MGLNFLCGLALDNRRIAKPLSFDEGELLTLAGYLAPIEYIEKELAKIYSPVLPMWSASTGA